MVNTLVSPPAFPNAVTIKDCYHHLATLHATFYASSSAHPAAKQSNEIIPIATLVNNTGAQASVPPQFTTNVTLPTNTVEVYAEIYASGNGNEEFWVRFTFWRFTEAILN